MHFRIYNVNQVIKNIYIHIYIISCVGNMDSQKAHTAISYKPVVWDHLMEHVERLTLIGLSPGHPTADRGVLSIVLQERSLHIAAVKGPTCQVSCWKKGSTNKIMVLSQRHCCVAISWFHTTRWLFSIPENM